MRSRLIPVMMFLAVLLPAPAPAAGGVTPSAGDTAEVRFFLYNLVDTAGQDVTAAFHKFHPDPDRSKPNGLAARPDMFAKPILPAIGDRILAITKDGAVRDEVRTMRFYDLEASGGYLIQFGTKRYKDQALDTACDGGLIFALPRPDGPNAKKMPEILGTSRVSKRDQRDLLKLLRVYLTDPARDARVGETYAGILERGVEEGTDLDGFLAERFRLNFLRIDGRSRNCDIRILQLHGRPDHTDSALIVFNHGKVECADYGEFLYAFHFGGTDYLMARHWGGDNGVRGLTLYAVADGVLTIAASDYSYAD